MLPKNCPVCKQKALRYIDKRVKCTNCKAYEKSLNRYERLLAWTIGKQWWWRVPILLWFVVMLFQNLNDPMFALNRLSNPFSALDFGMHELGHFLFSPFSEIWVIAGGSIFQCLFPLITMLGFIQIRWHFAAALCWCWLGLNFFDVATYAADARERALSLSVGFAGLTEQGSDQAYDRAHDWYQLLSRTGRLEQDLAIAQDLRTAAVVAFCIGFACALFLLVQMQLHRSRRL